MMKYKIAFIGILIICIYTSFICWKSKNKMIHDYTSIEKKANDLYIKNMKLEMDLLQTKLGHVSLNPHTILYTDSGDSILLQDIKKNRTSLVLRYSTYSCTPCVDDIILKMKDFVSHHPEANVVLLATYATTRDLRIFKRENKIFSQVYNVLSLNLPIEEDMPYLFLLDNDLRIADLFIPHKEMANLTYEYLQKIEPYLRK